MHEMTFLQMMKISLVMPVMLVLSIILVAVFIERLICFARLARIDTRLFRQVKEAVSQGKVAEARQIAESGGGLVAEALGSLLLAAEGKNRSEMDHVLQLYTQRIQALLGRRLGLFGTLSFISPLLGLLGTVLGVMTAFRDLALTGSGGPAVVAAGISEALIATAAGIGVAVTAALVFNYFNFRLKHVVLSLDLFGQEIVLMLNLGREI